MKIELDEGYQYGLGAFETIAVENNIPLFLDQHLDRLKKTLEFLNIRTRADIDVIFKTLKENIYVHHALKLMVSDQNCVITIRKNPYTQTDYANGFELAYSSILQNETSPFVYHKTFQYGDKILEKRRAKKIGVDEIIFLNSKGYLCEGSTTNLFFVKDGVIYTPSKTCGLLPGIMRQWIIEQYDAKELQITPNMAEEMESCFVTNSLMGIMPVKKLGNKIYEKRIPDKMIGLKK